MSYVPRATSSEGPEFTQAALQRIAAHWEKVVPNSKPLSVSSRIFAPPREGEQHPPRVVTAQPVEPLTAERAKQFLGVLRSGSKGEKIPAFTVTSLADVIADVRYGKSMAIPSYGNSAMNGLYGMTTAENTFQGVWASFCSWLGLKRALRSEDKQGQVVYGLGTAQGAFLAFGGAGYLAARPLSIACTLSGLSMAADSSSALGRGYFGAATFGNVFLILFNLCFGLASGYQLYHGGRFAHDWRLSSDPMDYLHGKLRGSPLALTLTQESLNEECTYSRWTQFWANTFDLALPKTKREELKQVARSELMTSFTELIEQLKEQGYGGEELSIADKEAVIEECLKAIQGDSTAFDEQVKAAGLTDAQVDQLHLDVLDVLGLQVAQERKYQRKEARAARAMGAAAVDAVKKALNSGLRERLSSTNPDIAESARIEAEALYAKVNQGLIVKIVLNVVGVLGAALGIATLVAFTGIALSNPAVLAFTALSIGVAILMFTIDFYSWKKGLETGPVGKYDKRYTLVVGALMAAIMATSVGLTFGLALPLLPFLIGFLGVGLPSLGFIGFSYYKTCEKEKRWKRSHATLEKLAKALDELNPEHGTSRHVDTLFKKLPKATRLALRQEFSCRPVQAFAMDLSDTDVVRACRKASKASWRCFQQTRADADRARAEWVDLFALGRVELFEGPAFDAVQNELASIKGMKARVQDMSDAVRAVQKMQEVQRIEKSGTEKALASRLHDAPALLGKQISFPKSNLGRFAGVAGAAGAAVTAVALTCNPVTAIAVGVAAIAALVIAAIVFRQRLLFDISLLYTMVTEGQWWHEMGGNVMLGGIPIQGHVEKLHAAGVTHVITLLDDFELEEGLITPATQADWEGKGIARFHAKVSDFEPVPQDKIEEAIRYIDAERARNPHAKFYIHCKAGRGRSATIFIIDRLLQKHKRNEIDLRAGDLEALVLDEITEAKRTRSRINLNPQQRAAIVEYLRNLNLS